ncbi:MAG: sigma 54-interacting transcriptional regulator [Clostridia bacterium]
MYESVITTDSSKCKQCYSCVRNCPVKAVRIKEGKAEIIQTRCIQCGNCVKHCSRKAKKIQSCIPATESIIRSGKKAIALLAPSYAAGLYPLAPEQIIEKLGAIGFDEVWETAIGAEYVIDNSAEYAAANNNRVLLSSPCPTFVNLVEKHFPDMIPNMIPISSPMIVTGRIIREKYKGEDVRIVFIGPCLAKKDEIMQDQFLGCINTALTYEEISILFEGIDEKAKKHINGKSIPYYTASKKGRRITLSGGIISNLKGKFDEGRLISCDGTENCIELIKHIEYSKTKGELDFLFYDVLGCRGCIDGACMKNDLLIHERQKIVTDFINRKDNISTEIQFAEHYDIDMGRAFNDRMIPLSQPDESSIKRILARIEKYSEEDELNCGACGYNTCREKAIAVYQGIAEVEMCIPYLLSQKSECYSKLSETFDTVNSLNEQLNAIFESSYDGMVVCDAAGKIIKSNSAWKNLVGVEETPETVKELEENGVIYPSAALLALKEKRRVTFLQECKNHRKFIATGNPIYDENKEIIGVVTNIRDIEELSRLNRNALKRDGKEASPYPGIIVNSQEFGKVLELAAQAAKYKSTVILLGETGVGKDVIAGLIHHLSPVKDGPFVKVNCGAIPEKLLESEFFGYEYGAFTGAIKGGKVGFFEQAHNGTIFLDEIGDLPLSLQVKLLQVIQDKAIRRIGSSKSEDIDIRIIAATNNDLKKMVDEGRFREDLYYRLNVISIYTPPLRERKDDIIPLAYHFLDAYNKQYGCSKEFAPEVPSILDSYYWPGNVRELQNIIERMVVTSQDSEISSRDIPPYINQLFKVNNGQIIVNSIIPLKEAISEVEKQIISRAYKAYGNTYKIAEVLGVNQSTIVRKLKNLQGQK